MINDGKPFASECRLELISGHEEQEIRTGLLIESTIKHSIDGTIEWSYLFRDNPQNISCFMMETDRSLYKTTNSLLRIFELSFDIILLN